MEEGLNVGSPDGVRVTHKEHTDPPGHIIQPEHRILSPPYMGQSDSPAIGIGDGEILGLELGKTDGKQDGLAGSFVGPRVVGILVGTRDLVEGLCEGSGLKLPEGGLLIL
jgi:hypothetical protein